MPADEGVDRVSIYRQLLDGAPDRYRRTHVLRYAGVPDRTAIAQRLAQVYLARVLLQRDTHGTGTGHRAVRPAS